MLAKIARWLGAHLKNLYVAIGAFLVLGFAGALLAGGAFALLVEGVLGGTTQRIDDHVVGWAVALSNPLFDFFALLGAVLGSSPVMWVVLVVGFVWLWRTHHHYSATLLPLAFLGTYFLTRYLKALFDRPRPSLQGSEIELLGWTFAFPSSPSFPSGHSVTAIVLFGTLAYVVARLEPTRRMRRWTLLGATALILMIGMTRVYLGVHYPSDVLAGYLAGFVWASTCALSIEVVRRLRGRLKGEIEEADLERDVHPVHDALDLESS